MPSTHKILRSFTLALLVVCVTALAGPARADREFTRQGTQPGLDYSLVNSNACAFCHSDSFAPEPIRPWSNWAGSMMANASRDPLFWAALDVANNDLPGVGDWCLRCHTPAGWLAGRSEEPGGSPDGCSLVGPIDSRGNDYDGVTCHLCHRMVENLDPPQGQQSFYQENAQWWIDDVPCTEGAFEPCRRGPYDFDLGEATPPHTWAYSALHESSKICSNCHNVTHPAKTFIVDGRDTEIPFPIERTSAEWERSIYSDAESEQYTTCQNCHMPDATGDPAYACIFEITDRSGNLPIHRFAGGNTWIPEVLRGEYPALGLANEYSRAEASARDMLQNRSATIELGTYPPLVPGDPLRAKVVVTNLTGHKLPTGYHEGRRMWLHVEARDAQGDLIWESGGYDLATAELVRDDQIKVYEARHGVWNYDTGECEIANADGDEQFHFALNNCIVLDNRIPPLGFDAKPDIETDSVNYRYPRTADGLSLVNYDVSSYEIPLASNIQTPILVTATLKFQTTSREYINFLENEAIENDFPDDCTPRNGGPIGKSRGEYLKTLWDTYGQSAPVDMVRAEQGIDRLFSGQSIEMPRRMTVDTFDRATGRIDLSWDPGVGVSDHSGHFGALGNVTSLQFDGEVCSLGPSGSARIVLPEGDLFWILTAEPDSSFTALGFNGHGEARPVEGRVNACSQENAVSAFAAAP